MQPEVSGPQVHDGDRSAGYVHFLLCVYAGKSLLFLLIFLSKLKYVCRYARKHRIRHLLALSISASTFTTARCTRIRPKFFLQRTAVPAMDWLCLGTASWVSSALLSRRTAIQGHLFQFISAQRYMSLWRVLQCAFPSSRMGEGVLKHTNIEGIITGRLDAGVKEYVEFPKRC